MARKGRSAAFLRALRKKHRLGEFKRNGARSKRKQTAIPVGFGVAMSGGGGGIAGRTGFSSMRFGSKTSDVSKESPKT